MTEQKKSLTDRIGVGVVVSLTAIAAITSGVANTRLTDDQRVRDREQVCTTSILFNTVNALNERTTYSTEQAQANIELQRAQARFLRVLLNTESPPPGNIQLEALEGYFRALQTYNDLVMRSAQKAMQYSYPTQQEYQDCLNNAQEER